MDNLHEHKWTIRELKWTVHEHKWTVHEHKWTVHEVMCVRTWKSCFGDAMSLLPIKN